MSKKTIFLVDDDLTNLMAVRSALESHYDVLTFSSGERLIKTLEKKIPDLILLDIEMPDMNGYKVIKIIKQNKATADIPVIFLTARNADMDELVGLSLGAIDYMTKPVPPQELLLKRIDVHMLVEEQKRELTKYNLNLQEMVKEKTASILELQHAIIKTMAELVECRDYITGGHIERTTSYLKVMLTAMSNNEIYHKQIEGCDLNILLDSAQLHDIGKIAVRDSVLQKPGKLTPEEFEEVKTHSRVGAQIIDKIKENVAESSFLDYARIFALSHHEKWDGTGYPDGLSGENIPLLGRVMAFADVYDALVSDRPYKKAFTHEEAVDIIKDGKGKHFDPNLVDIFVEVADEFKQVCNQFAPEKL